MEQPADARPRAPDLRSTYWLTRFLLLRLLGLVYAVAFLVAINQIVPLIGAHGLLPLGSYLDRVREALGSTTSAVVHLPTLFWLGHSDTVLLAAAWTGLALACVVLAGFANLPLLAALWVLYLSFVHAGQDWYGYGWEMQLLETGFLAIFLAPPLDPRPFPRQEPPTVILWLFRWLIFRIMLGAGLIKLRGDKAWRNLTALYYHFETQPLPNPLSRWFHFLPRTALRLGVVFNHVAELGAPWFVFWPRAARLAAGSVIVLFQVTLILSGNLSFLNWLTIIPALACFDDAWWARLLPGRWWTRRVEAAAAGARASVVSQGMTLAVTVVVLILSIQPALNMLSPEQIMNTSFDPLELVNTYGAFGTVGRERFNVVFEGTDAAEPDVHAQWKPYPYKGLPEDPFQRPPFVAPFQLRLDWQMWFAAMGSPRQYPWTLNLVWKLLHNDPGALSLFASNPFPRRPPRFIRAGLWRYQFAPAGNPGGRWWNRQFLGFWLPPLSADNPELKRALVAFGWLDAGALHRGDDKAGAN